MPEPVITKLNLTWLHLNVAVQQVFSQSKRASGCAWCIFSFLQEEHLSKRNMSLHSGVLHVSLFTVKQSHAKMCQLVLYVYL